MRRFLHSPYPMRSAEKPMACTDRWYGVAGSPFASACSSAIVIGTDARFSVRPARHRFAYSCIETPKFDLDRASARAADRGMHRLDRLVRCDQEAQPVSLAEQTITHVLESRQAVANLPSGIARVLKHDQPMASSSAALEASIFQGVTLERCVRPPPRVPPLARSDEVKVPTFIDLARIGHFVDNRSSAGRADAGKPEWRLLWQRSGTTTANDACGSSQSASAAEAPRRACQRRARLLRVRP